MSAWRMRIAIAGAPLVAACAAVLGIDDLPLATKPPSPPPEIIVPKFSPDACGSDAPYCVRTCSAFVFCDDFETESEKFERWQPPSVLPKPLSTGVFKSSIKLVEGGPEGIGTALAVSAESIDNRPETLALVHSIPKSPDGRPIRGLHMRIRGQLQELSFPLDAFSPRATGLFGIGPSYLPLKVVSFMVYDRGSTFALVIEQRDATGGDSPMELFRVTGVERGLVEKGWPEIEMAVGPRSLLIRNQFPCVLEPDPDASVPDGGERGDAGDDPLVAAMRAFGNSKCAPLVGELMTPQWLEEPTIFAGIFVTDYVTAKYLFDDIGVRYLF